MADVLITPASGKIEFYDGANNLDAKIELDGSGNLVITNPGGDISLGDTTADVFIGDGINNIDIRFEQDGTITGQTGITLQIGDSGSNVNMGTTLNLNNNNVTNGGTIAATTFTGALSGNASTASTLQTARTISLGGDVTGSASFNGSANITITAAVANDSHTHDTRYYTETEIDTKLTDGSVTKFDPSSTDTFTGTYPVLWHDNNITPYTSTWFTINGATDTLNVPNINLSGNITVTGTVDGRDVAADGTKLDGIEAGATADQTAAEILTAIKTVDGAASGLDADLLDGQQGSYYQPASSALTTSTTFGGDVSGTYNAIVVANDSHTHDTRYYTESEIDTKLTNGTVNKLANATSNAAGNFHMFVNDGGGNIGMRWNSTTGGTNTLVENGQAYELQINNDAVNGDFLIYKGSTSTGTAGETITWTEAFRIEGTDTNLYAYGSKMWTAGNDGSGSGLDADLLDGQQGSYYLDYNNFTNTPTGGGGITYVRKTTTYTAAVNDGVIADTSGGAWTLTLPASPSTGDVVVVADGADWSVNNLTVARNGSTIEGDAANMTMDIGGAHVTFIYDGTTWEIYTQIGAVGGSGVVSVGSAWSITDNAGNLLFAYNGVNKMKLDTSGNLTVVGDVTTAGTI